MSYKHLLPLTLALALLGAGCGLSPLQSSDQTGPRGYADVHVGDPIPPAPAKTDSTTPAAPADQANPPATTPSTTDTTKTNPATPASTNPTTTPPATTPAAPASTTGTGYNGTVVGTVALKSDANSIVDFMTAAKATYTGTDVYMDYGCDDVLVPVSIQVTKTQSDLATAIVQLLLTKEQAYKDKGLRNVVALSKGQLHLTNIHYDGKTRVVDLTGTPVSSDACDVSSIKAQIEETVKLYAPDYRIQLNGTATAWKCLGDTTGQCK